MNLTRIDSAGHQILHAVLILQLLAQFLRVLDEFFIARHLENARRYLDEFRLSVLGLHSLEAFPSLNNRLVIPLLFIQDMRIVIAVIALMTVLEYVCFDCAWQRHRLF